MGVIPIVVRRLAAIVAAVFVATLTLPLCSSPAAALGLDDILRLKDAHDVYKDARKFYDNYHWAQHAIENFNQGKPIPPIPNTDWAAEKVEQELDGLDKLAHQVQIPNALALPDLQRVINSQNVAANLRGIVRLHQWDLERLQHDMKALNAIQNQVDDLQRASSESSRLLREILDKNIAPGIVSEQIALAIISRDVVIGGHCTTISQHSQSMFAQLKSTYVEREKTYDGYDREAERLAGDFEAAAARGESERDYRLELNHAREHANSDDGFPGYRPSESEIEGRHSGGSGHAHGSITPCGSGCIRSTIQYEVMGQPTDVSADYLYIPAHLWVAEPPQRLPFVVPPGASIELFSQVVSESDTYLRVWALYEDNTYDVLLDGSAALGGHLLDRPWTNLSPFNATIFATANRGTEYSARPEDSIEQTGSAFLEEVGFFSFGYRPAPSQAAGIGPTPADAVIVVARTDGNEDEVTTPFPGEATFQDFAAAGQGTQLFSFVALHGPVRLQAQEIANGQTFPPFEKADWIAGPLYGEEREWTNAADIGTLQLSATLLAQQLPLTWRSVNIDSFTIAGAGFIPGDLANKNHPLDVVTLAEACQACDAGPGFVQRPRPRAHMHAFRNPTHSWTKSKHPRKLHGL